MANGNRIVRGYGLYEQLREHKPTTVLAFDGDGEETKINVSEVRNKHARVMTTLREIAWVRCDLLDKKGGLLYRHHRCSDDRDMPAGELEELPPTRQAAELSGLVNIMLRAQEAVLVRHQQSMGQVLDAQMRLVDSAMRRLELQEQQIEHSMRLTHQLSSDLVNATLAQLQLAAPQAANDEDGNPRPRSDAAIDALMPALIRSALGAPKTEIPKTATPKRNGVKEPTTEPTGRREPSSSSGNG